jgi:hypothetical protein
MGAVTVASDGVLLGAANHGGLFAIKMPPPLMMAPVDKIQSDGTPV